MNAYALHVCMHIICMYIATQEFYLQLLNQRVKVNSMHATFNVPFITPTATTKCDKNNTIESTCSYISAL